MTAHRSSRTFRARLGTAIAAGVLAVAVVVPAAAAAGPVDWQAGAGLSSKDEAIQVNSFLPRDLTVDEGDSITWHLNSGEFHTVTFLSGAAAPPFIIVGPGGPQPNPAAVAPSGGPTYDGTGIANSGLLTLGNTYKLGFTKAGTYSFLCLVHAGMAGTVHVQAAGSAYPQTQSQYDQAAHVTGNHLLAAGRALTGRTRGATHASGRTESTLGTGASLGVDGSLAIMRFLPSRFVIHAGETINWTNRDPETPHTVTFGEEPPGGPFGAFAPSGAAVPGHATLTSPDEAANSGFVGAGLPFGTTFSATFAAPGTYHFICALHDELGMTGTVVVLP